MEIYTTLRSRAGGLLLPFMHAVSVLTFGIFLAGYITARWDLVPRLCELAIFAWDHGVVTRTTKGFAVVSIFFVLLLVPLDLLASREVRCSLLYPCMRPR